MSIELIDLPDSAGNQSQALPLHYQVLLGERRRLLLSPRLGIIGRSLQDKDRTIAVDLNSPQCITLFGEPGSGKS